MNPQSLAIFLAAYCLVSAALAFAMLLTGTRRVAGTIMLAGSLAGLVAAIYLGSQISESNFVLDSALALLAFSRVEIAAFALGACSALPISALLLAMGNPPYHRLGTSFAAIGLFGTIACATLLTAKDLISAYLPNPTSQFASAGLGNLIDESFVAETFLETDVIPVRIAISPGGRIYVSGHRGIAAQEGGVVELSITEKGNVEELLVARMLNRPYGLIATDEALFVSRSGQYTKWNDGQAEQLSTGAITELRDTDNDGVMDYYHDVVTNLPGAKGPDYLHQNNGLVQDADGTLYITTANHADGHPIPDATSGAILRASGPNFSDVDIFASGLRNPFGIAFDAAGKLHVTDNDAQSGRLGGNLGDKLLLVSEGDFFGHPYAPDDDPDVTPPLLRSSFALGGLTLASSDLLPDRLRNSLFVVIYGEGRIMQVAEQEDGTTTLKPFAVVPGAVDVAAAPNGDFYVAVYPDKVVRLRFTEENS